MYEGENKLDFLITSLWQKKSDVRYARYSRNEKGNNVVFGKTDF